MSYTQYNYNSQPRKPPTCKYCSTPEKEIPIKFKKRDDGGWDRFNLDGTPHDRKYCDSIKSGQLNPNIPATSGQVVQVPQNTGAIDPHLNSILIKISFLVNELKGLNQAVMELKQLLFNLEKSAQTNATVIDNMAQKIELILAKTGYPEPKRHMVDVGGTYIGPKEEEPNKDKEKETDDIKTNPGFTEFLNNQKKIKEDDILNEAAVRNILPPEDDDKKQVIINPMRLPKDVLEENIAQNIEKHENNSLLSKDGKSIDIGKVVSKLDEVEERNKSAQVFKEQLLPAMEKVVPSEKGKPWTPISEMFTCDSCKTKSANGFEKYGTKICPDCNSDFELTNQEKALQESKKEFPEEWKKYEEAQQSDKEEFDKMNTEYDY